ncbi:Protein CHROMATIN REMODELING 20 [Diplonema papillatum]|nr:Protein CHROMATIN REMODELING 20 [Diplonema papillatum]
MASEDELSRLRAENEALKRQLAHRKRRTSDEAKRKRDPADQPDPRPAGDSPDACSRGPSTQARQAGRAAAGVSASLAGSRRSAAASADGLPPSCFAVLESLRAAPGGGLAARQSGGAIAAPPPGGLTGFTQARGKAAGGRAANTGIRLESTALRPPGSPAPPASQRGDAGRTGAGRDRTEARAALGPPPALLPPPNRATFSVNPGRGAGAASPPLPGAPAHGAAKRRKTAPLAAPDAAPNLQGAGPADGGPASAREPAPGSGAAPAGGLTGFARPKAAAGRVGNARPEGTAGAGTDRNEASRGGGSTNSNTAAFARAAAAGRVGNARPEPTAPRPPPGAAARAGAGSDPSEAPLRGGGTSSEAAAGPTPAPRHPPTRATFSLAAAADPAAAPPAAPPGPIAGSPAVVVDAEILQQSAVVGVVEEVVAMTKAAGAGAGGAVVGLSKGMEIDLTSAEAAGGGKEEEVASWTDYLTAEEQVRLKQHQREGIAFMWRSLTEERKGCILAHSMGLGKTLQLLTIAHCFRLSKAGPRCTVVAPVSLTSTWRAEARKWFPSMPCYTVTSETPQTNLSTLQTWHETGGLLITSYNKLASYVSKIQEKKLAVAEERAVMKFLLTDTSLLVIDEAHKIKGDNRTREACLAFATELRVLATGTVLPNRPQELFALIDFVRPNRWSKTSFESFLKPVAEAAHKTSTLYHRQAANHRAEIFVKKLEPILHRREVSILHEELPPIKQYVVSLRASDLQATLYTRYVAYFLSRRDAAEGRNILEFRFMSCIILFHPCLVLAFIERKRAQWLATIPSNGGRGRAAGRQPRGSDSDGETSDPDASASDAGTTVVRARGRIAKGRKPARNDEVFHSRESVDAAVKDRYGWAIDGFLETEEHAYVKDNPAAGYTVQWASCSSKLQALAEVVRNAMLTKESVLVFSTYTEVLRLAKRFLRQALPGCRAEEYTGSCTLARREELLSDMANKSLDVLLITFGVGGAGLTITAATKVVLLETCWSWADVQQAIFRTYRYGQTKPVHTYQFVTDGTIEDKLLMLMLQKEWMHRRLVDDDKPTRDYLQSQASDAYYAYAPTKALEVDDAVLEEDTVIDSLATMEFGTGESETEFNPLLVDCIRYSVLLADDPHAAAQMDEKARDRALRVVGDAFDREVGTGKGLHGLLPGAASVILHQGAAAPAKKVKKPRYAARGYATPAPAALLQHDAQAKKNAWRNPPRDGTQPGPGPARPEPAPRAYQPPPHVVAARERKSKEEAQAAGDRGTRLGVRPKAQAARGVDEKLASLRRAAGSHPFMARAVDGVRAKLMMIARWTVLRYLLPSEDERGLTDHRMVTELLLAHAVWAGAFKFETSLSTPVGRDALAKLQIEAADNFAFWKSDVAANAPAAVQSWLQVCEWQSGTFNTTLSLLNQVMTHLPGYDSNSVNPPSLRELVRENPALWDALPQWLTFLLGYVLDMNHDFFTQLLIWGFGAILERLAATNRDAASNLRRLATGLGLSGLEAEQNVFRLSLAILGQLFPIDEPA